MHQVANTSIWIGNISDARNMRRLNDLGIEAIVDLASNEPPVAVLRDVTYCRLPVADGAGNPPWLLRAALKFVAHQIAERVPTLVHCSAGLSRSPAIVAGALALATGCSEHDALQAAVADYPHDVSPGLWAEVRTTVSESHN